MVENNQLHSVHISRIFLTGTVGSSQELGMIVLVTYAFLLEFCQNWGFLLEFET